MPCISLMIFQKLSEYDDENILIQDLINKTENILIQAGIHNSFFPSYKLYFKIALVIIGNFSFQIHKSCHLKEMQINCRYEAANSRVTQKHRILSEYPQRTQKHTQYYGVS